MTSRVEADTSSTWTFDTASKGIGQLAQATGSAAGYVRTHQYDTLARPRRVTIAANGLGGSYALTYNTDSRLDTLTYPSGLVVKYVYTPLGYLAQLNDGVGGTVLWRANARDAEMHLADAGTANGVRTIQVFDPATGHLQQIRAGRGGSDTGLAQLDTGFDAVGNLMRRADAFGIDEAFCYDALDRLTDYAQGSLADCHAAGSRTVSYDEIGNITAKSDVGTYSYPPSGPGAVRPHAVSHIAGLVDGVPNPSYGYDANGNRTCEYPLSCAGSGALHVTTTYTAANQVAQIAQGTLGVSFAYDPEHNRITQRLADGSTDVTTIYLNDPVSGAMSERQGTGSTLAWRDYLMAEGRIVGQRLCTGAAPCGSGTAMPSLKVRHHLRNIRFHA